MILTTHQRQMRALVGKKPDLTLKELRAAVAVECSLPAIHYALAKMGLTGRVVVSGHSVADLRLPLQRHQKSRRGREHRLPLGHIESDQVHTVPDDERAFDEIAVAGQKTEGFFFGHGRQLCA